MMHGVAIGRFQGLIVIVVDDFSLGLLLGNNLHLLGVGAPQRHLEIKYAVFYRVVQGSVKNGLDGDTLDETHLDNTFSEGTVA